MKVSPVSADLLIKLGLGVAVLGAVGLAVWKLKSAIVGNVSAVNPASPDNVVNRGVVAIGDAVVSPTGPGRNADGSWTLGGFLFDVLNPGTSAAVRDIGQPVAVRQIQEDAPAPVIPADPYDHIFYRYPKP